MPFQLLQNKANINAVNEHGNTPLHYACFWNYDHVAEVRYHMYTCNDVDTSVEA